MNKRKKNIISFLVTSLFAAFLLFSCSDRSKRAFYEADISEIHIDGLNIHRYEEVLFNMNPFIIDTEIKNHQDTFSVFLRNIIDDEVSIAQLYEFVTDPGIIELYIDSKAAWSHTDSLEASLTDVFRFFHYHFPGHQIPDIYTYISGVDYLTPVKYFNNELVIGLDNYLGPSYDTYDNLGIPRYLSRRMRPEYLVANVAEALADAWLAEVSRLPETLLDHMIYQGKRQYFLDCMLPHLHDSLKIGYSGSHYDWISRYEGYAWMYKLDNDLLYSTDLRTINGFINEAPFTSRFSNQSAPRTGVWIGWQIVREYMRRNPDKTLPDLLGENDSRKILAGARYRP